QVLRPVSPLAWLPLGLVLFEKSQPAALFTIAICAMWPTVLNTALGVRAIPQDYLNVARVLQLSRRKTFFKILLPATLPSMFTGLSAPDAGTLTLGGRPITGPGRERGVVFQNYSLLPWMTTRENVLLAVEQRMPDAPRAERIAEAERFLAMVNLGAAR